MADSHRTQPTQIAREADSDRASGRLPSRRWPAHIAPVADSGRARGRLPSRRWTANIAPVADSSRAKGRLPSRRWPAHIAPVVGPITTWCFLGGPPGWQSEFAASSLNGSARGISYRIKSSDENSIPFTARALPSQSLLSQPLDLRLMAVTCRPAGFLSAHCRVNEHAIKLAHVQMQGLEPRRSRLLIWPAVRM